MDSVLPDGRRHWLYTQRLGESQNHELIPARRRGRSLKRVHYNEHKSKLSRRRSPSPSLPSVVTVSAINRRVLLEFAMQKTHTA